MRYGSVLLRLAGMALRRPGLGLALVRAAWRFRSKDWYRKPPFLPIPPARYIDWRLHTAYGESAVPQPGELRRYLEWSRRMRPPRTQ